MRCQQIVEVKTYKSRLVIHNYADLHTINSVRSINIHNLQTPAATLNALTYHLSILDAYSSIVLLF